METIFESSCEDDEAFAAYEDCEEEQSKDVPMVSSSIVSSASSTKLMLEDCVSSWRQSTGQPATVRVHVQDRTFELHELPLVSRSGYFKRVLKSSSEAELGGDFPGGADVFGTVASFCYGATIMVEPGNVAKLRCAAEQLEMGEEFGKGNLCELSDMYLRKVALQTWDGSYAVLQGTDSLMPLAEELLIVSRCVDSLAYIACKELLKEDCSSPNEPVWMEQLLELPYNSFARIVAGIRRQGMHERHIARILVRFVERWIFDVKVSDMLKTDHLWCHESLEQLSVRSEKCRLLESTVRLLPLDKQVIPVSFLFSLLKYAVVVLGASTECRAQLETRIAYQLEHATVDDFLAPVKDGRTSKAHIDSLRQIVTLFMSQQKIEYRKCYSHGLFEDDGVKFLDPEAVVIVATVWDGYLEELGYEPGINPVTFSDLIDVIPPCARQTHDQLYKAIHIYLKAHPHVTHSERVLVCKSLNCQKLSQEACIHAVQNELMPLRTIVQAMFMEQLQNRGSVPCSGEIGSRVHSTACSPKQQVNTAAPVDQSAPKRSSSHRFNTSSLTPPESTVNHDKRRLPSSETDSRMCVNHDFEAAKSRLKHLEKELAQVKKTLQQNSFPPGTEQFKRTGNGFYPAILHSQRTGIGFGHKLLKTFKKLGLGSLWKGKYNACYDVSSSATVASYNEEDAYCGIPDVCTGEEPQYISKGTASAAATPLRSGKRHNRSHSVS